MAAASPSTRPARTGRGRCHSSARPRHSRASTGTSVPPTVSEKATTGVAVTRAVQRSTSRAPARARAAPNAATKTTQNQILGSVSSPGPSSARGMPEQRHQRQVGVVDVGVVRGREHRGSLVGRAMVDEQSGAAGDDTHLRLPFTRHRQHRQRCGERAAEAEHEGQVHSPRLPGQHRGGRQQVGRGREQPPEPVRFIVTDQAQPAGERGARGECGGQQRSRDRGRRVPRHSSRLTAPWWRLSQCEHRSTPFTEKILAGRLISGPAGPRDTPVLGW